MKIIRSMVPYEFFGDGNPTVPPKHFGQVQNREALDYDALAALLTSPDSYRRVDQELAAGRFPEGLESLSNAEMVHEMKREVILPMLVPTAITSAFVGGALGWLFLANSVGPLISGVGGALLAGGLHTLAKYRAYTGTVTVERDGESSQRPFWLYPHLYQRSAQEARHLLLQKGQLGDRIEAVPLTPLSLPQGSDPELLARLKPLNSKLVELSKSRRLVADLGARSRYGEPALSLVDAAVARRLLAGGDSWSRKLFVVMGGSPEQVSHSYRAVGSSHSGSSRLDDHYDYAELRFGCSLQPLAGPDDLAKVSEGQGLPSPLLGVYRDGHTLSQVVRAQESERADCVERWGFFDGELDRIVRETNQLHDRQAVTA